MDIEKKADYFGYIKELERMGIAPPVRCHNELRKRFPNLDESAAERLVNLYIREEIEDKQRFLTE
jgi:hypothetical protein